MTTMNISLPEKMKEFVDGLVELGIMERLVNMYVT